MAYKNKEDQKAAWWATRRFRWMRANRERLNANRKIWYRKNLEENRAKSRKKQHEYFLKNPDKIRQYNKAKRISRRKRIIEAYGVKCLCCGVTDPVFLVLDHINEDGAKERREICGANGYRSGHPDKIYLRVIASNFPKDRYQLLCHNCNWAKSHGGCPHKTD